MQSLISQEELRSKIRSQEDLRFMKEYLKIYNIQQQSKRQMTSEQQKRQNRSRVENKKFNHSRQEASFLLSELVSSDTSDHTYHHILLTNMKSLFPFPNDEINLFNQMLPSYIKFMKLFPKYFFFITRLNLSFEVKLELFCLLFHTLIAQNIIMFNPIIFNICYHFIHFTIIGCFYLNQIVAYLLKMNVLHLEQEFINSVSTLLQIIIFFVSFEKLMIIRENQNKILSQIISMDSLSEQKKKYLLSIFYPEMKRRQIYKPKTFFQQHHFGTSKMTTKSEVEQTESQEQQRKDNQSIEKNNLQLLYEPTFSLDQYDLDTSSIEQLRYQTPRFDHFIIKYFPFKLLKEFDFINENYNDCIRNNSISISHEFLDRFLQMIESEINQFISNLLNLSQTSRSFQTSQKLMSIKKRLYHILKRYSFGSETIPKDILNDILKELEFTQTKKSVLFFEQHVLDIVKFFNLMKNFYLFKFEMTNEPDFFIKFFCPILNEITNTGNDIMRNLKRHFNQHFYFSFLDFYNIESPILESRLQKSKEVALELDVDATNDPLSRDPDSLGVVELPETTSNPEFDLNKFFGEFIIKKSNNQNYTFGSIILNFLFSFYGHLTMYETNEMIRSNRSKRVQTSYFSRIVF